jgi:hypothetical protein
MNVRLIIPDCPHSKRWYTQGIRPYLRTIAGIAGGYTSYRGYGGWIDDKGKLVEEPITIVDCSFDENDVDFPRDGFHALARTIARELSQDCVFLSIDGKAEFIRP